MSMPSNTHSIVTSVLSMNIVQTTKNTSYCSQQSYVEVKHISLIYLAPTI